MNESVESPDGYYEGTVVDAWFEDKKDEPDYLAAHFNVELDNGENVECSHVISGGKYDDRNRSVVSKTLGVSHWVEYGEDQFAEAATGKPVRVSIKRNTTDRGKTYTNAYIVTRSKSVRVRGDDVKTKLARLKKKTAQEDIPF